MPGWVTVGWVTAGQVNGRLGDGVSMTE